jgi:L-aspartate oxidase
MGSNSLLEGLVLGARAGERAALEAKGLPLIPLGRDLRTDDAPNTDDVRVSIQDMTYSLKSLMWRQMGIVRRGSSIEDALARIAFWTRAVLKLAAPEPRAWELCNMLTIARLASESALAREESRGTHFRSDFDESQPEWRAHTILTPRIEGRAIHGVTLGREAVAESVAAART